MDREESWQVIEQERRTLADLLDTLTDEEWERPSLCGGWRIKDVAAHVALVPHPPNAWTMLVEGLRARGNFHRLNHDLAVKAAERPSAEIVAELADHAGSRKMPMVTNERNILFDILVHGQDIAIPLGRKRAMPIVAARAGADRVWRMGWPFWAKRRLKGFRLIATDTEWTVGAGKDVHGPVDALLLLVTGRTASLLRLTGEGVAELRSRLTGEPSSVTGS